MYRFDVGSCCVVGVAALLMASPELHAADPGRSVYQANCSSCHDSGAGDAPRITRRDEWQGRFERGRSAMYEVAIRGKPGTAMAPKGGFAQLSDAEVRAAVDFMLRAAGFVHGAFTASEAGGAGDATAAAQPAASSGAARGDAEITAAVAQALRSALAARTSLIEDYQGELIVRGAGIRVSTRDGVVRLMGVVEKGDAIPRAERITRSVTGVRDVDNKLVSGGMLDFD